MGDEKKAACLKETQKLLQAGFIEELRFTTWLSNVVMVKKASGYNILSFLDAYSRYNQILMHPQDKNKTAFITELGNYCYKVMPFGLKNAGATYQRLMDKVFSKQIGRNFEVYVDDMVVKLKQDHNHDADLEEIFKQERQHNMRLNLEKCAFGILTRPEVSGRLIKWSIELSEFDITYEPRTTIKAQFLADFLAELTDQPQQHYTWELYVDGASKAEGSGAGVLLTNKDNLQIEQSIRFTFQTSNNQAEYEALLVGLRLAQSLNIIDLQVYCDSQLIVQQVTRHFQYLQTEDTPTTSADPKAFKRRATSFTLIGVDLYKRGFSQPLLCCLSKDEAKVVMDEVHEGVCGNHIGGMSLASKIARAGYYWPTMKQDCIEKVRRCDSCQKHSPLIHNPTKLLHTSEVSWPFYKWGLDILDPFPRAPGQVTYSLIAIDYFSKWIEDIPLAKIGADKVRSFIWKTIICRFGLPHAIITDNGWQFTDQNLAEFLQEFRIKHHFS
ncbi:uncharacterized protein LOC107611716 [Arachis ipaensis]|uniref:uncharacterized protein LOC107611716 n=1 Tax=Arachis ipaensis TaxID=130454 RepID=UPI0007AF5292|nr:uncharacterized protein LOC107611716 [Arachis ipaensis]